MVNAYKVEEDGFYEDDGIDEEEMVKEYDDYFDHDAPNIIKEE